VVAIDAGPEGEYGPSGSGVVVRDDGIVVTSVALVVGAAVPRVRLADGTSPVAALVGTDPSTGLAVLDLDGEGYIPSVLADGEPPARGATSYAISARSSGGTSTGSGVVGPAQRYVGPAGTAIDGIEIAGDADDRAIGGPVVDARGAVVGITTAVDAGGAWYVAPVAVARRVTDDLLTLGVARNSWLGIEGTDVAGGATAGAGDAGTLADGTGSTAGGRDPAAPGSTGETPATDGTMVASVVPESPAALGGLLPGDVVVALDGREITHMADLIVALRAYVPGDRVDVTVVRADSSRVTLVLTLGEAPAPTR
jgi:S1-C subfamily serine protease